MRKPGKLHISTALLLCALVLGPPCLAAEPFAFNDMDRVVFLGGTFFERDYNYGHLEAHLSAAFPDKHLTFRNLAWSGDNVWGASRAFFDTPVEGYQRLLQAVKDAKPTVIIFGYGLVESFETENTFEEFAEQLDALLDDLAETGARMVIVAPPLLEKLPPPLPDPATQNERLKNYIEHLRGVAQMRGHYFADMPALITYDPAAPMTDNTLHFTDSGYRLIAPKLVEALGHAAVAPPEALRTLILEKNRLFFNKWRPQNETYIFGFRKYEQGQYQAETPMYDPLVDAVEKQIADELIKLQTAKQE